LLILVKLIVAVSAAALNQKRFMAMADKLAGLISIFQQKMLNVSRETPSKRPFLTLIFFKLSAGGLTRQSS
jgi:hypothetical protein